MSWYLVARSEPKTGGMFQLAGGTINVGRSSDNDIILDDDLVSRYHARLDLQARAYLLTDLGSANGTWLNEHRLEAPVSMHIGDCIRFGTRSEFICSTLPYLSDDPAPAEPCDEPSATHGCIPPSLLFWAIGALAVLAIMVVVGAVVLLF